MKKMFLMGMALAVASMGFVACSDDDDSVPPTKVPAEVTENFSEMFPSVTNPKWEKEYNYYVADFYLNGYDTDAWYDEFGVWRMTETDYRADITQLPMAMQNAFNESQYSQWIIDDVEYYQRLEDSFAVVDIESPSQPDMEMYISSTGEVIKVVADTDTPILPTTQITAQ